MICRYPVALDQCEHGIHRVIYVPCNKCAWCKRSLRNQWFVRFVEESKASTYTRFVTYDYRPEDLPVNFDQETGEIIPTVRLRDIQLYHKILRKKYKFRFFLSSEYGKKNGQPHYHALYWSDQKIPFYDLWPHGEHGADLPATAGSFKYVTKYILKGSFVPDGADDNFHTMSRRPGIGSSYLSNMSDGRFYYRYYNKVMKLPMYYTRKANELLPESLRKVQTESRLDYLATQSKYESLLNSYIENAPDDQPIEDWIQDIYKIDLRRQFKINSK